MKTVHKFTLAAIFMAALPLAFFGCSSDGGNKGEEITISSSSTEEEASQQSSSSSGGGSSSSAAALSDIRPQTPEAMGSATALQYLQGLKMGWNLGNTLDAVNVPSAATETAWGRPLATQALFNGVKSSGFDIVRIPVTWIGHIGAAPDYKLDEVRLHRVAEVVGYAKTAGLKAIINIHHDGNNTQGNNTTWGFVDMPGSVNNTTKKAAVQDEITKVWTQIAEYFKNYGDYLIFETLNEVHNGNWGLYNVTATEQSILFDWNQAALSAIRATGGNNAKRYVAVPGLGGTEPHVVVDAHKVGKLLPNDPGNGTSKLIVAVHYYDPGQYTVAGITDLVNPLVHTWGTATEREELANNFKMLKTNFTDKGIAVYAGEYGTPTTARATMSETVKETLLSYISSVAAAARANGVLPIYWDDGWDFKILERSNGLPQSGIYTNVLKAIKDAIDGTEIIPPRNCEAEQPASIVAGSWTWLADADCYNGGTSEINLSQTAGTFSISGKVVIVPGDYNVGFASWFATPNETMLISLKSATSISFKVKGDGKTYKMILPTSNIEDYCYYETTFDAPATETTVTINIDELVQPNWGTQKAFAQSMIESIQWQATEDGTFSLTIKDLTLN